MALIKREGDSTPTETERLFSAEELQAMNQLQEEKEVTPQEMITHLEKYITDLKKQKELGHGEPWMDEHIRIEENIIIFLKRTI